MGHGVLSAFLMLDYPSRGIEPSRGTHLSFFRLRGLGLITPVPVEGGGILRVRLYERTHQKTQTPR